MPVFGLVSSAQPGGVWTSIDHGFFQKNESAFWRGFVRLVFGGIVHGSSPELRIGQL
jgi:hypothetical protein